MVMGYKYKFSIALWTIEPSLRFPLFSNTFCLSPSWEYFSRTYNSSLKKFCQHTCVHILWNDVSTLAITNSLVIAVIKRFIYCHGIRTTYARDSLVV